MKQQQAGFTIMELMIVIAIMAIAAGIAMPSFTDFVRRNEHSSHIREVVGALALARSEAVSKRTDAVLKPLVGTNWNSGWQVEVDGTTIRQSDPFPAGYTLTFTVDTSKTALTFNSRGVLDITASETVTLTDGHGNSSSIHLPRSGSAYIR